MNPILLRYVGFALVAAIAGGGGGYLAENNGKQSPPQVVQSGTIPAQPFPGQGFPAIPAIPAKPQKGKPESKTPTISFVQQYDIDADAGWLPKNQVISPGTLYDNSAVGLSFLQ